MTAIYVAGKTDDYLRVRHVQELCRIQGHDITFDWTQTVEAVGGPGLKGTISDDYRRECAQRDRRGVRAAELLIMLCGHNLCGTLIEVGMALQIQMPVWVVGTPERDSVFFELPEVVRFTTVKELAARLSKPLHV